MKSPLMGVHCLAIRRAFAGIGLGRYLLQWAEQRIAAVGKKFIRLDCMAENPALCAYYEQVGFTHRGETQGKGWKAALYEKKVPIV
jgi:GNAT superfamily N-acetyltransferase